MQGYAYRVCFDYMSILFAYIIILAYSCSQLSLLGCLLAGGDCSIEEAKDGGKPMGPRTALHETNQTGTAL
jgi:hypothetical protein